MKLKDYLIKQLYRRVMKLEQKKLKAREDARSMRVITQGAEEIAKERGALR